MRKISQHRSLTSTCTHIPVIKQVHKYMTETVLNPPQSHCRVAAYREALHNPSVFIFIMVIVLDRCLSEKLA